MKNYDAHIVVRHFQRQYAECQAGEKPDYDEVKVIPQNGERYLQFEIGQLRFLDSYQFLSASLDQLVSLLLRDSKGKFVHTRKHLGTSDLIYQKGVFPYSYMTGPEKFQETQLPPIDCFYDNLKDEPLKSEDYERAKATWDQFGIRNLREYHDLYLKMDVLLLADVFENFRETVFREHKLDCLHFVTLPSLAWQMALKHTEAELELITDPEAYLMIENSIRGGIATISERYASANNPYVPDFDESLERQYLIYLDANSLYATAQSEPLPLSGFAFLTDEEVSRFELDNIPSDYGIGYIIECDVEYPAHLHDSHNDYPMAPEHLTVSRDMLSPFALSLLDADPHRSWVPARKLVPNLLNKTRYVTYYRNLQLYVKHGLKLTKIHRILSFGQAPWLKPWIDLCNKQRREARSDFESDLAKLQANATFGKTMEQVRHRVNVRLIADPTTLTKAVSKTSYRQSEIINPDLVMVRGARSKVTLNKPIAVGFCILEISKLIMYKFYYDVMKAKYGERCSLLFTDTDSLCCAVRTHDIYDDFADVAARASWIPATSRRIIPCTRSTIDEYWGR